MDDAARKASTRHNTEISKMSSNAFGWERTNPSQYGSAGFGRLDAPRAGAKKGIFIDPDPELVEAAKRHNVRPIK